MLPFLQKKEGSASSAPESLKRESDTGKPIDSLEVAMKELFSAKSDSERAQAFRAAVQLLENQPHKESNG